MEDLPGLSGTRTASTPRRTVRYGKVPRSDLRTHPRINLTDWRFRVFGLVDKEIVLDWEQFTGLEKTTVDAEFHCVTQWSRLENTWEGVLFEDVLGLVTPKPERRM